MSHRSTLGPPRLGAEAIIPSALSKHMQLERVFRRRTQSALALLLAASAFGVVGCNDDKGTTTASVVPYLIQVTPPQSSLAVGGTQQLTAVVKDYYNNTMSTPV
ncbi:MAG: hypothetical protein ABJB66_02970, partial [Gemmatimonadaceae bacterium]